MTDSASHDEAGDDPLETLLAQHRKEKKALKGLFPMVLSTRISITCSVTVFLIWALTRVGGSPS